MKPVKIDRHPPKQKHERSEFYKRTYVYIFDGDEKVSKAEKNKKGLPGKEEKQLTIY